MAVSDKTTDKNNIAVILAVIGIVLVIIGLAIVNIKGMPFRGSGMGTLSTAAGIVLLVVGGYLFVTKRK
jgi:uncharacterized membrane protein